MSLIYGHRGASGHAPENTLEAFRLAMDMGADGFELDVHMSKDSELVVIHDETVDRTTDGTGLVRELTLEQLQALDACNGMENYRGAKIPTLAEVFELIRDTHHIVNVEVKTDEWFYPQIEEKCLALAKEKGVEDRVIYSSFNHHTLMKLRQLEPDAKLGMLFGDIMVKPWEYAENCAGSNRLLKEGARPVTAAWDVLAEYTGLYRGKLHIVEENELKISGEAVNEPADKYADFLQVRVPNPKKIIDKPKTVEYIDLEK